MAEQDTGAHGRSGAEQELSSGAKLPRVEVIDPSGHLKTHNKTKVSTRRRRATWILLAMHIGEDHLQLTIGLKLFGIFSFRSLLKRPVHLVACLVVEGEKCGLRQSTCQLTSSAESFRTLTPVNFRTNQLIL